MKVYIATPVNARREGTLEKKRAAAYSRMCQIRRELDAAWQDSEFHSSFDEHIAPIDGDVEKSEAVIMGQCVTQVMECDAVVLDYGWKDSRGCRLEANAAHVYGKKVFNVWFLGIKEEKL